MAKGHDLNAGYRPGDNWEECDRCGFDRRVSELKMEWNGLFVCADSCWEPRHEQQFLRVREERIVPDHPGTETTTANSTAADASAATSMETNRDAGNDGDYDVPAGTNNNAL